MTFMDCICRKNNNFIHANILHIPHTRHADTPRVSSMKLCVRDNTKELSDDPRDSNHPAPYIYFYEPT